MPGGYILGPESLLNIDIIRTLAEGTFDQINATTQIGTDLLKRVKDWSLVKDYPRTSFSSVQSAGPNPLYPFEPRPWKSDETNMNSQTLPESSKPAFPEFSRPLEEDQVKHALR